MSERLSVFEDLHGTNEEISQGSIKTTTLELLSSLRLRLVARKIPLKYCKFNISNTVNKMMQGETLSLAQDGATFYSTLSYDQDVLCDF